MGEYILPTERKHLQLWQQEELAACPSNLRGLTRIQAPCPHMRHLSSLSAPVTADQIAKALLTFAFQSLDYIMSLLIILYGIAILYIIFPSVKGSSSSAECFHSPQQEGYLAIKYTVLVVSLVAEVLMASSHAGMKPKVHANHRRYLE